MFTVQEGSDQPILQTGAAWGVRDLDQRDLGCVARLTDITALQNTESEDNKAILRDVPENLKKAAVQ